MELTATGNENSPIEFTDQVAYPLLSLPRLPKYSKLILIQYSNNRNSQATGTQRQIKENVPLIRTKRICVN